MKVYSALSPQRTGPSWFGTLGKAIKDLWCSCLLLSSGPQPRSGLQVGNGPCVTCSLMSKSHCKRS